MDVYLIHLSFIILGGILALIVPYYFKTRYQKLKFDYSYAYFLLLTIIISSAALVPEVNLINGKIIVQDLILGFGLQSILNKGNRERIRIKDKKIKYKQL